MSKGGGVSRQGIQSHLKFSKQYTITETSQVLLYTIKQFLIY